MSSGKKVLMVFTQLTKEEMEHSEHPAIQKALQKGTVAPLFVQQDVKTESASGALSGQTLWDAAKAEDIIVASLDEGGELYVADAASEQELGTLLENAMNAGGKKLLAVIVSPEQAVFYGLGIERGRRIEHAIPASSIAPTLAWLADLPLPAQVEAAPAYGVIKGLNFKMKEVRKMAGSMDAMMLAMERNNRKPWDKHDCA